MIGHQACRQNCWIPELRPHSSVNQIQDLQSENPRPSGVTHLLLTLGKASPCVCVFPLFLEREFPPSTLTKLGSGVQRAGLQCTTAVASLDTHTLFCPQAPDPEALSPRTAGAVEEDGPPSPPQR